MARVRRTVHPTAASTRPKRETRKTETTTTSSFNPFTRKRKTTKKTTTTSTGGARGAATHHKRKPHLSDKIAGALEKAKGTIERKPGKKAAGTRRMHGTDGRGSHHVV